MYTHKEGNIRYYNDENDTLFSLVEESSDRQRGMCSLPRRGLNLAECAIARAFKVAASSIQALGFIVPRKVRSRVPASHSHMLTPCLQSDSFESDISPLRRPPSLSL